MQPDTSAAHDRALARLQSDGVLRRDGEQYRTAARWQGAMARAAWRLLNEQDPGDDLRVVIVHALLELYGDNTSDEELATFVEVLTPIERAELSPERASPAAGP